MGRGRLARHRRHERDLGSDEGGRDVEGESVGGFRLVQAVAVLWVVIIIAVVPWGHVVREYVLARGERWRLGNC